MSVAGLRRCAVVGLVAGTCASAPTAEPAMAFNPIKTGCTVVGAVSPTVKKACTVVRIGAGALSVIKGLFSGGVGGALSGLFGGGKALTSGSSTATTTELGLAAIGTWVLGGAVFALHETAKALGHTTAPQLESTWFSSTYWRVAGIAAVLTLPFLFAAAVQALIRSDLTLLLRAALGYLPLAMLAVAIAAPLATLLLAAADQLASAVSSAAGHASTRFLHVTGVTIAALTALSRSPFMVFFVGLLTVAGAVSLWIELLLREAAVYVIVLMLPLIFAAMVWPARRVWAVRAVELLVALILSKFAIVAVLSLGGTAIGESQGFSVSGLLAGVVLIVMGVFAPWALLRMIPLAELASNATASLRQDGRIGRGHYLEARGKAEQAEEQWTATIAAMRRDSERGVGGAAADPMRPHPEPPMPNGHDAASEEARDPHSGDLPLPDPNEPDLVNADGVPHPGTRSAPVDGRIPHLPQMWQQDDLSWDPVTLGPEGVQGAPVWPPSAAANNGSPDGGTAAGEPAADDQDPKPPPQPPSEGRL